MSHFGKGGADGNSFFNVVKKRAPHSASDADAMTLRMMVEVFKIATLLIMVRRIDAVLPR